MLELFLWIFFTGLGIVFLYSIRIYVLDKRYRLPPGPMPVPFLGSVRPGPVRRQWLIMREHAKKYGPVFTFYFGQTRMIVLSDAKLILDTYGKQSNIFSNRMDAYMPGFEGVPQGIIDSNGDRWKRLRGFAAKGMRQFGMGKELIVLKIQDEAAQLIETILAKNGKPFDPKRLTDGAVANIICAMIFGKRFNYDDDKFNSLILANQDMFSETVAAGIANFLIFPFMRYFGRPKFVTSYVQFLELVHGLVKQAVEEHRPDFNPDHIRDFPDLFIQSELQKEGLNWDDFSMVMLDLFITGTDTTSFSIVWTLLYLVKYPEIQKKCHEAIDSVIRTERMPDMNDRAKLVYIDAVIFEVMRHSTAFLPNSVPRSNLFTQTKILDYDIPPMSYIVYNMIALHYDEMYWKNPEVFDPERFIAPDGFLTTHSNHFFQFGLGSRSCLGEQLGRAENFVFLTSLLQRFSFTLAKPPKNMEPQSDGFVNAPHEFEIIANKRQ